MFQKKEILTGIGWTGFGSLFLLVGYFILYGILFHLVESNEFAVFSLAQAIVSLGTNISASAFGNAIVSKIKLTVIDFSIAYWLSGFVGIGLGGLFWVATPCLGILYNDPEIEIVIAIIALVLPFAAFGQPFRYLLQREAQFKVLSFVRIIVFLSFAGVAIFGCISGYGAKALAWAFVSQVFIETICLIFLGIKLIVPVLSWDGKIAKWWGRFGLFQGAERLVDTLAAQVDTFLFGRFFGMEILGVYEAVKRVLVRPLNLVSDAIETVMFPVLAKSQNKSDRGYFFLENVKLLGLLCFFPYLLAVFYAGPLTRIILGNGWPTATEVFSIYAIAMLLRLPRMPTDALIMANGKPKLWFAWKFGQLIITLVILSFGLITGFHGALILFLILQLVLISFSYFVWIHKMTGVAVKAYMKNIFHPFVISIISVLGGFLVSLVVSNDWIKVLLGTGVSFVLFLLWQYKIVNQKKNSIANLFK